MQVLELINQANKLQPESNPLIWPLLIEELGELVERKINPYTLLRLLGLESEKLNKSNPSEQDAANFLVDNLHLIASLHSNIDALAQLKAAFEGSLEPNNDTNQLIQLLESGILSWDVQPYDPKVHGYSTRPRYDARGIKRSDGTPIKRLSGRTIIRMYFEPDYVKKMLPHATHYGGQPLYMLESKKGRLLHLLLEKQGNWISVDEILHRTGLERKEVIENITTLCYDQRTPPQWWIPLNTESHRPGSSNNLVTHYRLAPNTMLSNALYRAEAAE